MVVLVVLVVVFCVGGVELVAWVVVLVLVLFLVLVALAYIGVFVFLESMVVVMLTEVAAATVLAVLVVVGVGGRGVSEGPRGVRRTAVVAYFSPQDTESNFWR